MALRQARRFVLDTDLAEHALNLADTEVASLPDWVSLARLPCEHLWLETVVEESAFETAMHGMLFSRLGNSPCEWVASQFCLMDLMFRTSELDGEIIPLPWTFVVNTEGRPEAPVYSSHHPPVHEIFPDLLPEHADHEVWAIQDPAVARLTPQGRPSDQPWFSDKVYMSINPIWRDSFSMRKPDLEKMFDYISLAWGEFKRSVTTLAILNDVPVDMAAVPSAKGRILRHGTSIARLDHTRLELRIKAKRPVSWLKRRLNHSLIRKRAHEVRGHWRTYLDRSTGDIKTKIWIETHERGDRSLGFVQHSEAGGLLRKKKH
jgi:hypothetical protein